MFAPKVFNIGFHKTGTSSMGRALQKLGYRVCGAVGLDEEGLNDERVERIAQAYLPDFDAFQDTPWAVLYPRLDRWCPGSKFILTVRSVESWIASATRNFGADSRPVLEWIYGVGYPLGNKAIFIERYEKHNRDVEEYFRNRPDDLLVLDISRHGWTELCSFLDKPVPNVKFPHVNKGSRLTKEGCRLPSFWKRNVNKIMRALSS